MLTRPLTRAITHPLTRAITSPGVGGGFASIVNNGVLAPFVTFTRNSIATYVGSDGLREDAAANEPRIAYDPTTLALLGYQSESARTNLMLRSETYSDAAWLKSGTTVSGTGLGPRGANTANRVSVNSNGSFFYIGQNITVANGDYALTVYASAGTSTQYGLLVGGYTITGARVLYGPGSVGATGSTTITVSSLSASAVTCVEIRFTVADGGGSKLMATYPGNRAAQVAGDSISLGGHQVEAGAFSTSFIPTAGVTVQRLADQAIISDLSLFNFNAAEGTFTVAASQPTIYNNGCFLRLDDSTENERLYGFISLDAPRILLTDGGATQADSSGAVLTNGAVFKAAIGYKANDTGIAFNGNAVLDGAVTLPTVTRLTIGYNAANSIGAFHGCIRQVRYQRRRVSQAQLEAETEPDLGPLAGSRIAFIGDSVTELGNYPAEVAFLVGASSRKFGFGGCRMGQYPSLPNYDEMCGYKLAHAINTGNFAPLVAAAEAQFLATGDDNRPQASAMAAQNWNDIDVVVIGFGTNDWTGEIPLGTSGSVASDGSTFNGSINYIIEQITSAYPHIQIAFVAPTYRLAPPEPFEASRNSGNTNIGGRSLLNYVDAMLAECALQGVPAYDTYRLSGIDAGTQPTLLSDGVHPTNPAGYIYLAGKVAPFLEENFAAA